MKLRQASDPVKIQYYGKGEDPQLTSQRWWLENDDTLHKSVFAVANNILHNLSTRRRMNYYFAAMYNDLGTTGLTSKNVNLYYNQTAIDGNAQMNTGITVNVMQNVIDSACAMISKNQPKPLFVTNGEASYATRIRGKQMTKYMGGLFDQLKFYAKMRKMFRDSCVFGTGCIKFYTEDNDLKCENLFIEELLIDDLEGMHEAPTQIHQRKFIQRDIVIGMFPQYEKQIRETQQIAGGLATFSTADVIPVIESWHLRSSKKSKDGKHSICIDNCTLWSEPYTKDYYPILFYRWAHQTLGFWGRGICHEIWKIQREHTMISQAIQSGYRRMMGAILAVESGSNIPENHLTSTKLMKIIEYTVTKPEYLIPPIIQAEVYAYLDSLEEKMYKIPGVSQSQATGQKPPELVSKVAIREVADQATGRFELQAQAFEEFTLMASDVMVDMLSDLDNPQVMTSDRRKGGQKLNFKDVVVDRKDYKLDLFAVSKLASDPAGQLDQLMDYVDAGAVTTEQMMDVIDIPDLDEPVSLELAALRRTQEILSDIKEKGEEGYVAPGAYLDLKLAYKMACLEVSRSESQHVEQANIDLLQKWADAVQDLLAQIPPAPPPAPTMQPNQMVAPQQQPAVQQ